MSAPTILPAGPIQQRPKAVGVALGLLWTEFGLGLSICFLVSFRPEDTDSWAAIIGEWLGLALIGGPWAWLIMKVARGHNWARAVTVGCIGIGAGGWLVSLASYPIAYHDAGFAVSCTLQGLSLAAAALLSTRASRAWFRAYRQSNMAGYAPAADKPPASA